MNEKVVSNLWIPLSALLVLVLGPSASLHAAQQTEPQPSVSALEVEKVKENLYVIKGGGGNTTVFLNSKGVVLVDVKSPGWGKPLLEKVKTLTDKPVIAVINTHSHADHTSGNVEMPAGIEIVAQEITKKNMENMDFFKKPENAKGLPTKTFKDKMSLFSGPDRVDLYWFGPTETGGDTWVVFPALRTMSSGDAFARLAVTILNMNNGGSPLGATATLSRVVANIKGVDTIITGHDGVRTWDDLKVFIEFRQEFLAFVEAERKAGKSVEEVTADYKVPEKYQGYEPADPRRVKAHVQGIYDQLDKE